MTPLNYVCLFCLLANKRVHYSCANKQWHLNPSTQLNSSLLNKKALLSQRWPRDAPYIYAIHPNFVHAYGHYTLCGFWFWSNEFKLRKFCLFLQEWRFGRSRPLKSGEKRGRGRIQGVPKFFEYPLLSQERVKLRTSNLADVFIASMVHAF